MHKNLVRLLPGLLLVLGAPNDVFAGDPCSPPEVSPAVLQPDACRSAPNHCLADSRGLTSGYVPDRLIPLETKFPKDILTLSHPGRGPEEYKVTSKGAVYKMNPRGGGYGYYFSPPGEEDQSRYGYGDGWQSSIRDGLHANDWNPTQAGAAWSTGTEARIEKINGGMRIKRFNMPNFVNDKKDFLEADAINKSASRDFMDAMINGTDKDACQGETLDNEVRSEFDFQGEVSDYSGALNSSLPVFRFLNHLEYTRAPSSVMQFNRPADPRLLGNWVLAEFLLNLSPFAYQGDAAGITDMSFAVYSWGLRLKENSSYRFLTYKKNGDSTWSFENLSDIGASRERTNLMIAHREDDYTDRQFKSGKASGFPSVNASVQVRPYVLMTQGRDPERNKGIALYFPGSATNRFQTIGVKDGKIVYAENRLLAGLIVGVGVPMGENLDQIGYNLTLRLYTNGLIEPRKTAQGIREGLRSEILVFYGTPDQIEREILKLEKSGAL